MPISAASYRLPKSSKLRRPADFSRVYAGRIKVGDGHLLVFGADNPDGLTRIGLSVSKKHGNAVARNRIKRLLREAFRLEQHALPRGLDLILIPRQQSGATLDDYRQSLRRCTEKLRQRLETGTTAKP